MLWTILPTIYILWEFNSAGPIFQDPLAALQSMQSSGIVDTMDIALTFPGPIYSIWRRVKKSYACPQCNEKIMISTSIGIDKKNTLLDKEELSVENKKEVQKDNNIVHNRSNNEW